MTWRNLHDSPSKSIEARRKISASRIGKPTTTGRALPQSQRDNIAASLRGRPLPPEQKAKIRSALIAGGHKPPPGHRRLRGEEHPNWKGGHSPLRVLDRNKPEYKAFRLAVMERDDWTCQDCGKRGGKLHAHHLTSWAENSAGRYDLANGVALCPPCHHARHRGVPRIRAGGPRTLAELLLGRDEV